MSFYKIIVVLFLCILLNFNGVFLPNTEYSKSGLKSNETFSAYHVLV